MRAFLTAFLGSILLFVVVCPLTPTPIAVLDGKAHTVHAPVVSLVPVAALAVPGLEAAGWNRKTSLVYVPALTGDEVVDLTCSRLC